MERHVEIELTPAEAAERLDRVLARRLPELSRTRLKALIEAGLVADSDGPVLKASARAQGLVTIELPPPEAAEPQPEAIPLAIVFEDADLVVVDKPAGLVVHPAPGHWTGTLVNALLAHCGAELSGVGGVRRPGIVHRLDKDTSGLLVVAKSDAAHRGLAEQFADHGRSGPLEREYLAFVWGAPREARFTVEGPIGRDPRNREKMAITPSGKPALTHVERRGVYAEGEAALLACRLETGRTHQIRVHLASRGHPVIGDDPYGAGFRTKAQRLPPEAARIVAGLGRQALHAHVLGFAHPTTGRSLRFRSELPPELARLQDTLTRLAP
jgi:23S rRNA pseudouridine1911/1915/1917 synthase